MLQETHDKDMLTIWKLLKDEVYEIRGEKQMVKEYLKLDRLHDCVRIVYK